MTLVDATVALAVSALLLVGCGSTAPDGSEGEAAEEVTEFADPAEEDTGAADAPEDGDVAASVELPGLPVGGNEVVFQEPSTQCASVNTTNFDLPEGVRIAITRFDVPPEFAVSSGACGSAPPCLSGHAFVAGGSSCEVAVTWNGAVPGDGAALVAGAATATCDTEALCGEVLAGIQGAAGGAIQLVVLSPEEETTG
jgi:hypothetical protein